MAAGDWEADEGACEEEELLANPEGEADGVTAAGVDKAASGGAEELMDATVTTTVEPEAEPEARVPLPVPCAGAGFA